MISVKKYKVGICVSGYCWYMVRAEDEDGALMLAKNKFYSDNKPVIHDPHEYKEAYMLEEEE
jgi:hypothetical protein